jgi:anti-sigma-K factor RskA
MSDDAPSPVAGQAVPAGSGRPGPPRARSWGVAALVVAAVLVVTVVLDTTFLARGTPPPGVTLTDLHSVDQFRSLFDAGDGTTRLVLILSPT